jgi:hypothetical protein
MDQCSYPRDARDRISRQRNATSHPSMEASREQVALPLCGRDATRCRGFDLCLGGASRFRCRPKPTIHTDSERPLRRESQPDVRGLDLGVRWRRARDTKRVVDRIASGSSKFHPPRGPSGRAQVGKGVWKRLCRVPKSRSSIPLAAGSECRRPAVGSRTYLLGGSTGSAAQSRTRRRERGGLPPGMARFYPARTKLMADRRQRGRRP